jgi:hypothetical protein
MNNLLLNTIALVAVFSVPASAALAAEYSPPKFRAIPDVSRNMKANPEQRQSTEQRSMSRDVIGQASDPELR